MMKRLYGIRGAVTAENTKESISEKTVEMCSLLFKENNLKPEDFVSLQFTLTNDLDEMNPCAALRRSYKEMDVSGIPLFCSQEAYVKGALARVVRVLATVYMEEGSVPQNVYLGGAAVLRPDLKGCK
ncbi:MAG: chorismate mutase [Treponema sp.]|nr:chorismate mutase [Treponema sp.]